MKYESFGNIPSGRLCHTAAIAHSMHAYEFIIYGGEAANPSESNSFVYTLDLRGHHWSTRSMDMMMIGDEPTAVLPPRSFHQNLLHCLESGQYSDAVLRDAENTWQERAHRIILTQQSDHLRAMLCGGMKESVTGEIVVQSSQPVIRSLLRYLYTEQLVVDEADILDLLRLANTWLISPLVQQCAVRSSTSSKNDHGITNNEPLR